MQDKHQDRRMKLMCKLVRNDRFSVVSDQRHSYPPGPSTSSVLRIRPSHQPESTVPPRFARTILHPSTLHPSEEININLDPPKPSGSTIIPTSASSSLMAQGNKAKQTSFRYDRVLGEDSRQEEVYEAAGRGAVERFLKGLNVTVLA